MSPVTISLEDEPSRFRFQQGQSVARRRDDGSPDLEDRGIVAAGAWSGEPGAGSYDEVYEVRRADGLRFRAKELDLLRLPTEGEIRKLVQERGKDGTLPRGLPPAPCGELEGRETITINGGRRQPGETRRLG